MNRHTWVALLVVGLVLGSCVPGTRYHHFVPLPREGWDRQDTLTFVLPADSLVRDCRLAVELRATRLYPYTGMWVGVEQSDSAGSLLRCDTLYIAMTDSAGTLDGHGQTLMEYASPSMGVAHASGGTCRQVRLHHLMSCECVAGVSDVGVRVYCPGQPAD